MANYKAQFKTALGQHEIVLDTKVTADMVVGQVCKYTAGATPETSSLAPATDTDTDTYTLAAGDYIVAQSDMTMEYGHVPVENRDYRYVPKVAASATAPKKVAVFKITDIGDVYTETIT